jgi:hypothetical protein
MSVGTPWERQRALRGACRRLRLDRLAAVVDWVVEHDVHACEAPRVDVEVRGGRPA